MHYLLSHHALNKTLLNVRSIPISSAGAYWLALFRLRRVQALRTWLEALGFCLIYWLVMPILLGIGSYALQTFQLLNQSTAISPGAIGGPWDNIMLAGEIPGLILYAVLLALGTSGIALGSALFFARWDKVREAHLPSRAWLEFFSCLWWRSTYTSITTGRTRGRL